MAEDGASKTAVSSIHSHIVVVVRCTVNQFGESRNRRRGHSPTCQVVLLLPVFMILVDPQWLSLMMLLRLLNERYLTSVNVDCIGSFYNGRCITQIE
jgi:hypothetical protein